MTTELTIFNVMAGIDKQQYTLLTPLTEEQQKVVFKPVLTFMWLVSSTTNTSQYELYNDNVNRYLYDFYNHPKLLFLLMCGCGLGKSRRYVFKKRAPVTKKPKSLDIISQYNNCTEKESLLYLKLYSYEDIVEMGQYLGLEPNELKPIKKEWDEKKEK